MSLTLVCHSPCPVALYGAMSASVAQADDAALMHLPIRFPSEAGADSVQMVAAGGALVPSGLLWYERLTAREVMPASSVETIIAQAGESAVVVPWDAAYQSVALLENLLAQAAAAGVRVRRLTVRNETETWYLVDERGEGTAYGRWRRDGYGRWVSNECAQTPSPSMPALSVALIGTQPDQMDVYPATLAALADAAETTGVVLQVQFVDPQSLDVRALEAADAIVLPGGSDMNNVPGQISAARHALVSGTPILGLCLGMQSMTTALAQSIPGLEQANMAEAAPDALIKSFVPMAGWQGLDEHRLGDRRLSFRGPDMEQRFQAHSTIRCNHRFMLNPDLIHSLTESGMVVTATDTTGQVVDAMAWPHHVFYQGMQGHPEQCSRAGNPHPLITDFLQAAKAAQGIGPHA